MHTNHPPVTGSRQTLLVLRILRVSLHVMFAFLLIFGAVLTFIRATTPAHATCICLLVTALAATYLTGTIYENHRGIPTTYTHNPTPHQKPPRFAPVHLWLTVITALWLTLMTLDSAFTWVVFPIMFLYLHLLTPISGVTATLILCALAVTLPLAGPASPGVHALLTHGVSPGAIVGPTLGALLATVISFTYRALRQDSTAQYQLAQQLRAVQTELTHQQYSAGKLAERERLAREIHDTLAQGLSSIVLVSRAAASSLTNGHHSTAAEQLDIIHTSATSNLAEARRFIKDLSSPALQDPLPAALSYIS